MPITEKWDKLSLDDWRSFARAWIAELHGSRSADDVDQRQKVVLMNFTASAEQQWTFVQLAVEAAQSEQDLEAIAAGPLEHLLGRHGDQYIAKIEKQALMSRSFAIAVAGVWRNGMSDDAWSRVERIKKAME